MIYRLLLSLTLFFSCNGNSPEKLWEQVIQYRQEKNLQESIAVLHQIIDSFPEHEYAPKAIFQIGDIYLNEVKDYDFAIEFFKQVLDTYPDSPESEKANFMIGYVFSNNLQSYTEAEEYYTLFLRTYPESELVPSVEYELEILEPIFRQIDSLNAVVGKEL
tara:strand:+ start:256 stop:738 length:483 start_codon:yes stop_codon:yes gene_type:complete